ncbi:MAG: lytic transglycosylase domain-containing protein [Methylococcales bacterium]|nr:lytic transglycosylase domain-containing protein [Methylococcales bacterium]
MKLFALIFTLVLSAQAQAEGWQCWEDAANRYQVPVDLLYAVARVETGNKAKITSKPNKNGTYDIGLMQINSTHLGMLKKYGITENRLLDDACLNLHVGAWILAESIERHGYNWKGIGAYNAGSNDKRKIYASKVIAMYERIVRERDLRVEY